MRPILVGIETEYGLQIEGKGAEEQVEQSQALVRDYTGEGLMLWDYRHESPRNDLRGFRLDRLAVDPVDAKFDAKAKPLKADPREDRILPNGARFYNDHGHPEYSTPECFSLEELALHDLAGQRIVRKAAREHAARIGREVSVYKNNTDFHGASYGTHESYSVPRDLSVQRLYEAVLPMLVVRQVLTGAGKVGAEVGSACNFQLSQRADFFMEPLNAETLFRRPIFNTRDEPHADPERWLRMHVISGDANMNPRCTMRKVGLVQLAVALAEIGEAPVWTLADPVRSIQTISRDSDHRFEIALGGRNWTNAGQVLESYFSAAERLLDLTEPLREVIEDCRFLLSQLETGWERLVPHIDWAAKLRIAQMHLETNGGDWNDATLQSLDLAYSNLDTESSLYEALVEVGEIEGWGSDDAIEQRRSWAPEGTRASVRGLAASKFASALANACWRSLTFRIDDRLIEVELMPDRIYPAHLCEIDDVMMFIEAIQEAT